MSKRQTLSIVFLEDGRQNYVFGVALNEKEALCTSAGRCRQSGREPFDKHGGTGV